MNPPDFTKIYLDEAAELLEELEYALLELESEPQNPELIGRIFRTVHTIKGSGDMFGFTEIAAFAHHTETALDQVRNRLLSVSPELIRLLFASRDYLREMVLTASGQGETEAQNGAGIISALEKLTDAVPQDEKPLPEKAEEDSGGEWGIFSDPPDTDLMSKQYKSREELLADRELASKIQTQSQKIRQSLPDKAETARADTQSIRVAGEKLDQLIDLVGELLISQESLSEILSRRDDPELNLPVKNITRISKALRENALNLRMLPIGPTFARFRRLVRDMGKELGKHAEIITEGDETELDKNIIDRLNDPLVHLIRNSMDHGIENPAERKALGKEETARIRMAAAYSEDRVLISVEDDGRGLDAERIRRKAWEKGLLPSDRKLSTAELHRLIFTPGFSTVREISTVSGRGVGMDVVTNTIENELKGRVTLESESGKGCRISLSLPLTLAIIEGMLAKIGSTCFILPLTQVEKCLELPKTEQAGADHRGFLSFRGESVPCVRLRDFFHIPGSSPETEFIVIMQEGDTRLALVLDAVLGNYQTVLRPLGKIYRNVRGISGTAIIGNGEVAFFIDTASVLRHIHRDNQKKNRAGHS